MNQSLLCGCIVLQTQSATLSLRHSCRFIEKGGVEDIVRRLNTGVGQGDSWPKSRSRSQCGAVNPYSSCKCVTKASFEVASCCKQSVQLHRLHVHVCATVVLHWEDIVRRLDTGDLHASRSSAQSWLAVRTALGLSLQNSDLEPESRSGGDQSI